MVKLLDALEKQGLIRRTAVKSDRRAKEIAIENKGRETLEILDGFAAKMRDELFEGVTEEALQTTLDVLRHLSDQLEPRLP